MIAPTRYHLNGFPPANLDWKRLVPLVGQANAALARYDGLVAAMPNAKVLLSPLTVQEAVLSSTIEGTNVTLSEVLELEAGGGSNLDQLKRDDAEEIKNYRNALRFAAEALKDRPFSQHLLREAHDLLMRGVRGQDKTPGAFRNAQNWIGSKGCTIETASFLPIPQEHLLEGIDRWSAYFQSENEPDSLVQLAIIHVEFEALHPFKDGNGRLGRMLIPLFLYARRILSAPNFYMSGYLEANREKYVQTMRDVSRDDSWTEWCAFFLQGLIEQASENQRKARNILDLHRRMPGDIAKLTHSQFSPLAVEFIFSRPVFSSSDFIKAAKIPKPSAMRFLSAFREAGLLRVIRDAAGRRPAIYAFPELINIVEGRDVL
jgi:Fic family protein